MCGYTHWLRLYMWHPYHYHYLSCSKLKPVRAEAWFSFRETQPGVIPRPDELLQDSTTPDLRSIFAFPFNQLHCPSHKRALGDASAPNFCAARPMHMGPQDSTANEPKCAPACLGGSAVPVLDKIQYHASHEKQEQAWACSRCARNSHPRGMRPPATSRT